MTNAIDTQGALHAMETYFNAQRASGKLRVNASGDVEVAGRFTMLFDRLADRFKSLFIAGYQPVHWRDRARDAVIGKLEHSLATLLPANDPFLGKRTEALLSNISHQLERSDNISWRRAMAMELDLLRSSDAGTAMSNALRLLVDIGQIGNPELEKKVIAAIGAQHIDFALMTAEGQQAMLSGLSQTIAQHLQDEHSLSAAAAGFGADALLQAMQGYGLDLDHAMRLLEVPGSLRKKDATATQRSVDQFILDGIARAIGRHTGVASDAATKGARNVEFCMRRYALDWKQALDLVGLASRLAARLPALRTAGHHTSAQPSTGKLPLGTADLDCARAIQQVMARDGCDTETAMKVVAGRIGKLEAIRPSLPPRVMPSIVDGLQFHLSSPIAESSKRFLADQIRSLDSAQQKVAWRVPGSTTDIPLSENYLKDSIRSLRVVLDDGKQVKYFDERNAETLTESIHAIAGDAQTMTALCDSVNQTIQASILRVIVEIEQRSGDGEQLLIAPGEDRPRTAAQRLWNSVTLDGQGNILIRHLFVQKIGMIVSSKSGNSWPVNHGKAWEGDVSPVNAGLAYDFSYAFKLSDLRRGLRNPEIRDCHYTIAGSLDWDSIDRMPA